MADLPTKEQVLDALRPINDPELGYSVVDLGLVYDVRVSDDGACEVLYTLTSPGCPFAEELEHALKSGTSGIPGVSSVTLTLTFEPPWGPEKIADPLRRELRMMGLAV